ncbi:Aste57867_2346 [Aphanomyces stellatus]|uniref:Aste57867_2346 protein n=1 Tax=Aphanomyces stellatus TaxID=120398 RepID=A0A485KD06_9STRA|nr:hypothetical protein As57867_002341 [Aphanomyces stellatus]VFT79547.1 Aste57867_2346 [Aphanomyces stellatus]
MKSNGGGGGGSGLSLERFIRGKARPNKGKGETASGKRKRVEKAVLLRNYRKEKERSQPAVPSAAKVPAASSESGKPASFYDKFFAQMNDGDDNNHGKHKKERQASSTHRPDPLFKAKQKAQMVKDQRNQKRAAIEENLKVKEKKVEQRKKRHVKMSLRTKTGQPVVKHQIKDILAKLKSGN